MSGLRNEAERGRRSAGARGRSAVGAARAFRGLFVVGTDTGVGKTEVSCALLSLLADDGRRPVPFKPFESGCARLAAPSDALALREAARSDDPLEQICPFRFRAPLAPGVAAVLEGRPASVADALTVLRAFHGRPVVAEAAGGLLVPLDPEHDVLDLVALTRLPALLVARAGLGTVNHTGLSLETLRRRRVPVVGVALVQERPGRDPAIRHNAATLAGRHPDVPVVGPIPFRADPKARRRAMRRALAGLVDRVRW